MTQLIINNISLQHSNGDIQFSNLHLNLPNGLTGLVGNNGVGKSLLLQIIKGELKPSEGIIETSGKLFVYEQNAQLRISKNQTVADHFGASTKLDSLKRIEQGSIAEADFYSVGDDWLFASKFNARLRDISSSIKAHSSLFELSGGELSKVLLSALFSDAQQQGGILILDEPSNHLDSSGRKWLAQQLQAFNGKCLLISHDKALLNLCSRIANLTKHGIDLFEANYDVYEKQRELQKDAQSRKLLDLQKQQKHAKENAQKEVEKAQQRSKQGAKKAKKGSLPKVLLGARKNKAELSSGNQARHYQAKRESITKQIQNNTPDDKATPISFGFAHDLQKSKRLFSTGKLTFPFIKHAISIQVKHGEKWHVKGDNGSGKSTFLSLLQKASIMSHKQVNIEKSDIWQALNITGSININVNICLLDQHSSLIRSDKSILDNLSCYCPHIAQTDLRTVLASNGFRKDKVFQLAGLLSGGEKMRLAMLIASHQLNSLLLLDEPDNHLDIANKELLSDALCNFKGSYILVSHDNDFVSRSGITNTLELS